jgi:hypothetical protein
MTGLFTASYGAYRDGMGLPVMTSRGLPLAHFGGEALVSVLAAHAGS